MSSLRSLFLFSQATIICQQLIPFGAFPMKKKRKPTRAQQEAQASFDAMIRKWANLPKFAHTNRPNVSVQKPVTSPIYPPGREPQTVIRPSESSFQDKWVGGTKPVHSLRYTGDKLVGIGVMHKSNSVPVFNSDQAVEIARMRRG